MGVNLFHWFVKITGWPVQWLCFRTKFFYEDRSVQGRRIRGAAILVSNHTSVFDYAVFIFTFPLRTLRYQMAELLFRKPMLGPFLRCMGGILVDRSTHDLGFIARSQRVLDRGGVVGIFPEGRLPLPGEERPLPFRTGAAFLALSAGVPVIPVYTNGSYFGKNRAKVVIGCPVWAEDLADPGLPEKERIGRVSEALREKVKGLEAYLQ